MKFNSQLVSRIIFLLFIVIISVYFMFSNNKNVTEKFVDGETEPEPFLETDKDTVITIIKELYMEIYSNDIDRNIPSQKAIDFYYDYASQRTITRSDLKDIIQSSAPALERTLNDGDAPRPPNETFGTEDDVQEAYNEILFRNPDENELYSFSKMVGTDKSFNIEKLKKILFASDEYKRLEKTQSNTVYSNLMGNVTDRQLALIITNIYKQVNGNDSIDNDTMSFLKKKFIEFNLDEKIFTQFLTNYLKNIPFNVKELKSDQNASIIANAQKQTTVSAESTILQNNMEKFKEDILTEVKNSFKTVLNEQNGYTTQDGQEQTQVQNPNHQVIEILLRTAKEDQKNSYIDSQNIINQIKKESSCVFNKNASDNKYSQFNTKNSVAELQDKRNTEELRNTCVRNIKYLGVDEDMVLDPSLKWTVPQFRPPVCTGINTNSYQPNIDQTSLIGTLLADANESDNIIGQANPAI